MGIQLNIAIESEGGWTGLAACVSTSAIGPALCWTPVVGEWHLAHDYRQPGDYVLTIWLQLRDGSTRLERRAIRIPA